MRKLIASTFASPDGVMQAPGGPTEDPTGNFTLGGWLFAFADAGMDISAAGFDGKDRELVALYLRADARLGVEALTAALPARERTQE